eukprot:scaffold20192_cov80-Skeletonema_menzelii.AAC.1
MPQDAQKDKPAAASSSILAQYLVAISSSHLPLRCCWIGYLRRKQCNQAARSSIFFAGGIVFAGRPPSSCSPLLLLASQYLRTMHDVPARCATTQPPLYLINDWDRYKHEGRTNSVAVGTVQVRGRLFNQRTPRLKGQDT